MKKIYTSPGAIAWKRFKQHKLALSCSFVLIFLGIFSLFGSFVFKQTLGPQQERIEKYETIDMETRFASPSRLHPFGTDDLGHDVFMRIIYGGRISLSVGLIAAVLSGIIGILIGSLAGYFGRSIDTILMRFTDAMLSLPMLPLMIVMAAVDLDKIMFLGKFSKGNYGSVIKIVLIVVFFGWMGVARLIRGEILSVKENEYVQAARALGVSTFRIITQHIIPNCLAPIIVAATLQVGTTILYESVLSFLGLGIQPPVPSWGNMLTNAQEYIQKAPLLAFCPGFFITITVVCFNFIGDGLRDALDPHYVFKGKK